MGLGGTTVISQRAESGVNRVSDRTYQSADCETCATVAFTNQVVTQVGECTKDIGVVYSGSWRSISVSGDDGVPDVDPATRKLRESATIPSAVVIVVGSVKGNCAVENCCVAIIYGNASTRKISPIAGDSAISYI
jgi:hypothetical protein